MIVSNFYPEIVYSSFGFQAKSQNIFSLVLGRFICITFASFASLGNIFLVQSTYPLKISLSTSSDLWMLPSV